MNSKHAALILAAGYSTRMMQFKPLMPLGESTIIEEVIYNFRKADISDITVVIGHRADVMLAVLDRLQVKYILNKNYNEGMFSSILSGVRALSPNIDGFFLLPIDIPLVRSHTIKTLSKLWRKRGADIIYPVFQGQRGHPPLISRRLVPEIVAWNRPEGLRPLFEQYESSAFDVEVVDSGILRDMDTPEDYHNILAKYHYKDIPRPLECDVILAKFEVSGQVIQHGKLVAELARRLAVRLNQCGAKLDIDLVMAAGLLHDLAKGKPSHARYGARVLASLGYSNVADVVACHTDIIIKKEGYLDEAAIVYFADKLVRGDSIVSIEERFRDSLTRITAKDDAKIAANQRFLHAKQIADKIEQLTGASIQEIVSADAGACCELSNRKTEYEMS